MHTGDCPEVDTVPSGSWIQWHGQLHRAAEQVRWAGITEPIPGSATCSQGRLLWAGAVGWVLNISRIESSTTSLGKLCQCLVMEQIYV